MDRPVQARAIGPMSISHNCRPWPPWGESMHTQRPSGLKRGWVSPRHWPWYDAGEWNAPSSTRRPVATW